MTNLHSRSAAWSNDMGHLIRNCRFKFKCGAAWEHLDATDDRGVRYCGGCERTVHLCTTDQELAAAMLHNRCVAIPKEGTLPDGSYELPEMMVGEVRPPYVVGGDRDEEVDD